MTGDEIVVTSDAGFRAAYCRRPHHPQLIVRRRTDTEIVVTSEAGFRAGLLPEALKETSAWVLPSGLLPVLSPYPAKQSLKEEAPEQFPPRPRLLFATSPPHESSIKRLDSYCVKKRKHRHRQTQNMKKPRTGGAGLLGFHGGEPVMARERHHTTRLRLYRFSVSGILSHRRKKPRRE